MIRPYKGITPKIHSTAYIEESAHIIGDVEIGEYGSIWCNAVLRGDVHYIILDGAEIGEETIIGAGALVTERSIIPPRSLVLGMPGKITRQLKDEEVAKILKSAKNYIEYSKDYGQPAFSGQQSVTRSKPKADS